PRPPLGGKHLDRELRSCGAQQRVLVGACRGDCRIDGGEDRGGNGGEAEPADHVLLVSLGSAADAVAAPTRDEQRVVEPVATESGAREWTDARGFLRICAPARDHRQCQKGSEDSSDQSHLWLSLGATRSS